VLRYGQSLGYYGTTPMPRIAVPSRQRRERFFEEDEIARLLKACAQSKQPALAAIVQAGLLTGSRKDELLRLRWTDINFSAGLITIRGTKTEKSTRAIPMNQTLYDLLVSLQPDAAKRTGHIFPVGAGAASRKTRSARIPAPCGWPRSPEPTSTPSATPSRATC
jgi:integrase